MQPENTRAWGPSCPVSNPTEAGLQGGMRLRVHKLGEKSRPWRHLVGLAIGNSLGRLWASWASGVWAEIRGDQVSLSGPEHVHLSPSHLPALDRGGN